MSKEQAVWDKAKSVRGCNPDEVRQDPYGNLIHRHEYGQNTQYGWSINHIEPVSLGGSDHIRNLQALKTSANLAEGDSWVKKSRHNQ